jgi:transposase InsO family protein
MRWVVRTTSQLSWHVLQMLDTFERRAVNSTLAPVMDRIDRCGESHRQGTHRSAHPAPRILRPRKPPGGTVPRAPGLLPRLPGRIPNAATPPRHPAAASPRRRVPPPPRRSAAASHRRRASAGLPDPWPLISFDLGRLRSAWGRHAFLKAHWEQLAAIDFTTIEVWTQSGLVTYYLLFAMRLATRRVCFLGCAPSPVSSWMAQMACNLTDAFDGMLRAPVRYVLLDRDAKFTAEFQAILTAAEVRPVLLPPKSPNCNAHLERFFRSLKEEALSRIIMFGEAALRNATTEFLLHYHGERAHQGLDHQILKPGPEVGREVGVIACRERLGGLLKYYHRQAA